MCDVVSAHQDHTGDLRVVLVDALRGRAEDVISLGLPRRPDQDLVIDGDLVIRVEVLLGVVALGREEEVNPGQGAGHGAPLVAVRGKGAVTSARPGTCDVKTGTDVLYHQCCNVLPGLDVLCR